jgi:serine/threonine-protein kinase RsbW
MKKRTLRLKSTPAQIHIVEKFVEEVCDENNINNTYFGNILVAVTEAFENAMIHGNENKADKIITLSFETREKGLMFEIKDEGHGFDASQVPDATDVEGNPDKKGTGLFLIKSLTDEVRHTDNGRCIQMLFYIASINKQMADERVKKLSAFKKETKKEDIKRDEEQ